MNREQELDKIKKLIDKTKEELKGYEQEWDMNVGELLINFAEKYNKIMRNIK